MRIWCATFAGLMCLLISHRAAAQQPSPAALQAGPLTEAIALDGLLNEAAWTRAMAIDNLTMSEPAQGAPPSSRTRVIVLAGPRQIVIGVICEDADPAGIVSHTTVRDASLANEDHIKIVLDTFRDGRSGYVFAVNPGGARYDALIDPGGETENANWDGIWEAATHRAPSGWSVEIRIPVATLSFRAGETTWAFNVQRRIQRLQETDRWSGWNRDFKVTQTSRAGFLTDLPPFDLGIGLSVRPAVVVGGGLPAPDADIDGTVEPSLDVTKRMGANMLGSVTVNTDFAETEVDTRKTNFTRFPLFFPEKRTFFLEGADIFAFGLGLGESLRPYYSRRIGLVDGTEVPIVVGGKLNGRARGANLGVQVVRAGEVDQVAPGATLGVVRVKQNVLAESSVGAIATFGDPRGRSGSWLAGADFTYQTSRFHGNRNFLAGVWGLVMDREDLGSDRTAAGVSVDYPNDLWDTFVSYRRIGRDFDPSLGFVARPATHTYTFNTEFKPRPRFWNIRQMFMEWQNYVVTDLSGQWESYQVFTAPVNWRFESGDRVEWNWTPTGERLTEPFDVVDGITIAPGSYHWTRYRLEAGSATKRRLSGQMTWRYGGFYDGSLDQLQLTTAWNPIALVTVELTAEHDIGRLSAGDFTEDLVGSRLQLNLSPDLQFSTYVQYDTMSRSAGLNSRLRWTFFALGDLFVIYNHNVRDLTDRWQLDSNQLLIKFQYAFRY
jgi:hypothetical protein